MKIKLLAFGLIVSLIGLFGFINTSYAGIPRVSTKLASEDSDNDGYSDLSEYLHETDPNDIEDTPSSNITINVPSDVKSIQTAIGACIDGDTIVVFKGKYKGNINFNGKSITLTSTDPLDSDVVAKTIIEGTEDGSVVTVDTNSTLKGLTITSKKLDCRGIYVKDTSPTIENCTIIDNETTSYGGGIYIANNSSPKIISSIITGNADSTGSEDTSAQVYGGTPEISYSVVGQDLVNTTEITITAESITTAGEIHGVKWDDCNRNGARGPFVVFVIDISDSMGGMMDTEKEAFTALNQKLIDYGFGLAADISIVTFNTMAYQLDMDPVTEGVQLTTKPNADMDNSGTPDVEEILESLSDGGGTKFEPALQKTIETIDQTGATYDGTLVIFMSDGAPEDFSPPYDTIETLRNKAEYVRAFSVGYEPTDHMTAIDANAEMYTDPQTMWESTWPLDFGENGEPPLEGVTIYLDFNDDGEWDDGVEPSTTTDADGKYSFTGLSAGTYIVREVLPSGWLRTFPAEGFHEVILGADDEKVYSINFGNWSGGCSSIWYVDDSVAASGDGTSWATAFKYLQDALNNPDLELLDVNEIRVAQGTYKPDQRENGTTLGDRTATFQLKNGVIIEGGYAGNELVENRDFEAVLNSTWPYIPGWSQQGMWYIAWDPSTRKGEYMYIYVASYNQKPYQAQIARPRPALNIVVGEEYRVQFNIRDHGGKFNPDGAYATIGGAPPIPIVSIGHYEEIITATTSDNLQFVVPANALSAFQLDDVSVSNTNPDARDIETYETILSGDLIGNDGNPPNFDYYGDNSYHVVTSSGVYATLDGFIIEGGNSNDTAGVGEELWWSRCGGGMRNESSLPTVKNCTFRYNSARYSGGAIANLSSSPEITNCTFIGNRGEELDGGAIYNYEPYLHVRIQVKNCTFKDNYSYCRGGAIKNESTQSTIINCMFSNNTTPWMGGAIDNGVGSSTTVTNCVFAGNTAGSGGGLSNRHSSIVITNCTFNKNQAGYAGGVYNQGDEEYSSTTLRNCIVWDNPDNYPGTIEVKNAQFFTNPINVSYCDIKGFQSTGHSWSIDPLFVDTDNPLDNGLQLSAGSLCIDRADDSKALATDILGEERIDIPGVGYRIADMGAYEFIP